LINTKHNLVSQFLQKIEPLFKQTNYLEIASKWCASPPPFEPWCNSHKKQTNWLQNINSMVQHRQNHVL